MRFPKLKLTPRLLRLAYCFVDIEATGCTASPSGRIIEYSFVIGKLAKMRAGRVLDVGCASQLNYLPAALCSLGWEVWGIDQREWRFRFPNFHFVTGDIRSTGFPDNFFDCVYDMSTIEHVGIRGRYGIVKEDSEGDYKEVQEVRRILRGDGRFLVTLPYGSVSKISGPMGRVYSRGDVQKLFSDWRFEPKGFYAQDREGFWMPVSDEIGASRSNSGETLALLELINQK